MSSHAPNEPPRPGALGPDAGRADGMASNVWMFGLAGVAGVILLLFLLLI